MEALRRFSGASQGNLSRFSRAFLRGSQESVKRILGGFKKILGGFNGILGGFHGDLRRFI